MRTKRDDQRFDPARQTAQAGGIVFADGSAIISAAAEAWCCPEGCAYLEAEREAECDALTGCDGWLRQRVEDMLVAGFSRLMSPSSLPPMGTESGGRSE